MSKEILLYRVSQFSHLPLDSRSVSYDFLMNSKKVHDRNKGIMNSQNNPITQSNTISNKTLKTYTFVCTHVQNKY
jgi:hypothetical protein